MVEPGRADSQRCSSCGRAVAAGAAVCAVCGEPTTAPERKLVTLLFADLTGYTELCSRLDPEEVHHFVRPAMTDLRRTVEAYGGTVPQVYGDGFLAVFGAPVGHEDDAERAVRAALELTARIRAINERGRGLRLPDLHIGVNTGEVLVAGSREPSGMSVAGDTVNVASRLCSLAAGGQTLVGERTFELTCGAISYGPRRMRRVKGITPLVPVYEPIAARSVRHRGRPPSHRAPFQGRGEALAALDGAFRRVTATGTSQVLVVTGDAGLGKSRLAAEFASRVPGSLVLSGSCPPYGEQLPLSALAECVAGAAGLQLPASGPDIAAALGELCDQLRLGDRRSTVVRRLAPQLGHPEPDRHGGADDLVADLAAVRVLVEALSRRQPVVLVLDDLHWGDHALQQALASVHRDPWAGPVLLLGLARPEADLPGGLPALPIGALDRVDMVAIAEAIAGGQPPEWLADELLDRAGGNPLFLEECVRMLAENGGLRVDVDGRLIADLAQLRQVPNTMRMFIAARLDALPIEEKALLQDAAVGGDATWDRLLARLAPGDDTAALLDRLEERGLLTRHPVSRMPDCTEYGFKHALIRDVAYDSLPRRARAARHRAVADWMREVYASAGMRPPLPLLAHHYRQSWQLARSAVDGPPGCEIARLAVSHLAEWGRESLRLQARVAERAFDHALEVVAEAESCFDTATRAALHADRASARNEIGRFGAALEDVDAAEALLAGGDGDPVARATIELHRSRALSDLARIPEAKEACDRAFALYVAAGDKAGQAAALYQMARNGRYDDLARMNDNLREAYHACREAGDRSQQAEVSLHLAYLNTLEGGPQFVRWYAEAQRLTDEDADLRGRAGLRRTAAFRAWYAGDYERALTLARDAAADAADAGSRWVEADALLCQQAVLTALGRVDEVERVLRSSLDLAHRLGGRRLAGMAYARGVRAALRRRAAGESAERLREARERLQPLNSMLDLMTVDAIEAESCLDAGRWAEVGAPAQRLVDMCESRGWGLYALSSRVDVGRAALGLGGDDAVDLLAAAVDAARRQDAPRLGGLATACLEQAQLLDGGRSSPRIGGGAGDLVETRAVSHENDGLRAWRSGDPAAAAVAFGAAAAEWSALGTTVWLARALVWQAEAARRAGDADGAARVLEPVPELLADLGAPDGLTERVRAALP